MMQVPFIAVAFRLYGAHRHQPRILHSSHTQLGAVHAFALHPCSVYMRGAQPAQRCLGDSFAFCFGNHINTSFLGTNGAIRQVSLVVPVEITVPFDVV